MNVTEPSAPVAAAEGRVCPLGPEVTVTVAPCSAPFGPETVIFNAPVVGAGVVGVRATVVEVVCPESTVAEPVFESKPLAEAWNVYVPGDKSLNVAVPSEPVIMAVGGVCPEGALVIWTVAPWIP